jgi:hypothetical protein
MDHPSWQQVDVPVIAGEHDLALLRIAQPALPESLEAHLRSIELGGQELAELGFQVNLVPVWGPLFYAWCDEVDQDPTDGDAIQRFIERPALVDVRYSGYQEGPIAPVVELEVARSRAIAAVLAGEPEPNELAVAQVWTRATQLLRELYTNARTGTQLDILCPSTGANPVHWHLDGTTCRTAVLTVDHVLVALLEGLGSSGTVIVVDDGLPIHEVRVWCLGSGEVIPLAAAEARTICEPEPGAQLLDAWGLS